LRPPNKRLQRDAVEWGCEKKVRPAPLRGEPGGR
jgi:hypothetical protein